MKHILRLFKTYNKKTRWTRRTVREVFYFLLLARFIKEAGVRFILDDCSGQHAGATGSVAVSQLYGLRSLRSLKLLSSFCVFLCSPYVRAGVLPPHKNTPVGGLHKMYVHGVIQWIVKNYWIRGDSCAGNMSTCTCDSIRVELQSKKYTREQLKLLSFAATIDWKRWVLLGRVSEFSEEHNCNWVQKWPVVTDPSQS